MSGKNEEGKKVTTTLSALYVKVYWSPFCVIPVWSHVLDSFPKAFTWYNLFVLPVVNQLGFKSNSLFWLCISTICFDNWTNVGVEGGFALGEAKYDVTEKRSVVILPAWEIISLPDGKPDDPVCSPMPDALPPQVRAHCLPGHMDSYTAGGLVDRVPSLVK